MHPPWIKEWYNLFQSHKYLIGEGIIYLRNPRYSPPSMSTYVCSFQSGFDFAQASGACTFPSILNHSLLTSPSLQWTRVINAIQIISRINILSEFVRKSPLKSIKNIQATALPLTITSIKKYIFLEILLNFRTRSLQKLNFWFKNHSY